jgi:DNA-binding NarL/FixJ family response regulator
MMECFLMAASQPFAYCENNMFKILLIDRCHFTRTGFEAWLNHSGLFPGTFMVTGLNNLFLAREHILHWKPTLVIADLNSFMQDMNDIQQLSSLLIASETLPFILLQSGEVVDKANSIKQYPLWASLSKSTTLEGLATVINDALSTCASYEIPQVATPLLTRQEEKVLTLWMDGASNQVIAGKLSINSKTVYTYKRNIRMKLHMDTRFSPFLSLQEAES